MSDARSEQGATAPDGRRAQSRRVLAALFWLLASLSILVGGAMLWAHQTLLTSDGWGDLVGEVISEPEVVEEISVTVVDRVSGALDIDQIVADVLPGPDIVAGALTAVVKDRVVDGLAEFVASDGFGEAFATVNEAAHDAAMKAIRGGDSEVLTSEEGVISLNIFPLIEGVLRGLQGGGLIDEGREIPDLTDYEPTERTVGLLETLLGRDLPDDIGTITLIDSENLALVQEVVRYFDLLTVLSLLLTVLFVGLALWLSASRIRMVVWLAGGDIAALAVGRVLVRLILNRITDRAQEGDTGVTVLAIIDAAVESLMWFTFFLMAIAAVIAAFAWWWERRETGERPARETPLRTLGHWIREHALAVLGVGAAVIGIAALWNVGGADIALLTAAALGLLVIAVKVLSGDDEPKAPAPAPSTDVDPPDPAPASGDS